MATTLPNTPVAADTRRQEPVPVTDGELLLLFSQHNQQQAFEQLVRRHAPLVWSTCRQVLRQRQDIEDACQATFLILARRASDIRSSDSAAGWLYRVAHRTSLALWREQRSRPTEPIEHELAGNDCDPLEDLQLQHDTKVLAEELQALPSRFREPLVLFHLEGLSQTEVADRLDHSPATIKGRLARGRRLLRSRLARRGVALSVATACAAAGVKSAEAAVATTPVVSSTVSAASEIVSTTASSSSAASSTVLTLVQQGAATMYFASLAKPAACLVMVAALGVGVALANDSQKPKERALVLVATVDEETTTDEGSAVAIAKPSKQDRTASTTREVVIERSIAAPVVTGTSTVPTAGMRFGFVGTPQPSLADLPSVEELELESEYWRTRAEGLQLKAKGMRESYETLRELAGTARVSRRELAEASVQLGESKLMEAEVYRAHAKVLELKRKIKERKRMEELPRTSAHPARVSRDMALPVPSWIPAPAPPAVAPEPNVPVLPNVDMEAVKAMEQELKKLRMMHEELLQKMNEAESDE